MRKLRRQHVRSVTTTRREPPVMIVRPHNPENLTCQQTSAFITKAVVRGIAECQPFPTKQPELARNWAIADFLENYPRKTHIFMLDDDSPPFNPFTIEVLLRHNKPVVCAPTPICRYDRDNRHFKFLWNTIVTAPGHTKETPKMATFGPDELPQKLFRCYRVGGTGLLIRREVLEKLEAPYQKTTYNETYTDVLKSEDIYFADKIRAAGYEIWADGETVCDHWHRLNILDMFAVYTAAKKEIA